MSLIVICGATATGKSDLAINLAKQINAEVVNADSMQLYKGMDIGTAKASATTRAGIKHHLIDVLNVTEDANVAWYQEQSRKIIDQLLEEKKNVIVVGGTGLYIKAILDDLNFPETNVAVREKITKQAEKLGADVMHQRLSKLDPAAAAAIPKENVRRVVRALEVIEITGKPFTANLPRKDVDKYPQAKQFGLVIDRDNLDQRIDQRVEKMWRDGFVAEVKNLIQNGLLQGKTAKAALGYSQIIDFIENRISEEEAKQETKRATRAYARRQETWFSRDERIKWLKPDKTEQQIQIILDTIK